MVHMVQQIKTFTHTSTEPYDRHTYKLVLNDGNAIEFDDYDQLKACLLYTSDAADEP